MSGADESPGNAALECRPEEAAAGAAPIGPYVVDFFCPEFRLVIEIDGSQHAEEQAAYDHARTRWLAAKGYKVIRFWNNEVLLEPRSVADAIYHALLDRGAREPPQSGASPRTAPPQGGSEGKKG